MARPKKTQNDPEQLTLIEVDHPHVKEFKEKRAIYNGLNVKAAALRKKIKEAKESVLTVVREKLKIKPDVNGVTKFLLDGEVVNITPGESKLNFSTAPIEEPEEDDEEEKDEK